MSSISFQPNGSAGLPHRVGKEPGIVDVANETMASATRITREGRKITYRMRIIQQPNRARACGSGAKSCADRRPVDPPPILELKIFEGHGEQETEITWDYNANFFVFTTLEYARHMAPGKGQTSSQNSVPVLTGSPIAGMALLERPHRAGYFIFPDLSVRHEGKYRLNFSLYEELKNQKDMDSEAQDVSTTIHKAHVSHRLEVKTEPFTVFSAKKFPGLTTSTNLSIQFAEQGCRVRIRRDARLRGRPKRRGDHDEEQHFGSGRPSAAPESYYAGPNITTPRAAPADPNMRSRAGSVASNHSVILPRRPSTDQIHAQFPQGPYAASPQSSHDMYPPQPQWPHSAEQHQHQPYDEAPAQGYPPVPQHHQYSGPPQPMAPPAYSYGPQYPHDHHHSRRNSMEYPPSSAHPASPRPVQSPPSHEQPLAYANYNAPAYGGPSYGPPHHHASPVQQAHDLPAPQYPPPYPRMSPRNDSVHAPLVPLPPQEQYYSQQPPTPAPAPAPQAGIKRDYGSSFDTRPMQQPLRDGARPSVSGADVKYALDMDATKPGDAMEEDAPMEFGAMSYRRADGSLCRRRFALPE